MKMKDFAIETSHQNLLLQVINLTDLNDEVMYEVQFHVGSAFSSVQSSSCEIHFTIYGTNNVIGPVTLPVSPFEQDGVASFLISTMKTLGDIGTICVFCKDMNLRYSSSICHHLSSSSIQEHLLHTFT